MFFIFIMFREKLYECTKSSHKVVDRHKFVNLIRNNKDAGELYINMNKICIKNIQEEIQVRLSNGDSEWESFRLLFGKLYRDIEISYRKSENMNKLVERCIEYPLEHGYMFILGLLFGGKLLSRYLPEHTEFLQYDNSKELINDFKDYLDENVKDQDQFINIVNESYKLISEIFDEFCIEIDNKIDR